MSCCLASNRVRSETFGKKYQQSAMETFGRVYRVGLEDKKLVFARLSNRILRREKYFCITNYLIEFILSSVIENRKIESVGVSSMISSGNIISC